MTEPLYHVSDLNLERFRLNELSATEREAIQSHLSKCGGCQQQLENKIGYSSMFLERFNIQELSRKTVAMAEVQSNIQTSSHSINEPTSSGFVQIKSWLKSRYFYSSAIFASACALTLFVWTTRKGNNLLGTAHERYRFKGSVSLRVHVQRGPKQWVLNGSEAVMPHDVLQFSFDSSHAGYVYLGGADEKQPPVLYSPPSLEKPRFVRAGVRHSIEGAIALDAIPGREHFSLCVCKQPLTGAEVKKFLDSIRSPRLQPTECTCAGARFIKR